MQLQRIERFERLTSAAVGMNVWALTVSAPLSRVLAPGYLDRFAEQLPRRGDRIMVTCDGGDEIEIATLVVVANVGGSVTSRQLP
jgi:hypothetical protein